MAHPVMWFEVLGQLDRAAEATLLDHTFEDEPGKTLRDLLTRYGPAAVRLLDG